MSRHIFIAAVIASGCGSVAPPVASQEAAIMELTCSGGVESAGPNKCMTVPPVNKPAPAPNAVWDPFITDGVRTQTEYFGAIDFPYVYPQKKLSGGQIFVNIEQNLKTLHVFLENIPALPEGEIRVYLDNGRFTTSPDGTATFNDPTLEDRAYAIDLKTGAKRILRAVNTAGVISWQPIPLQLCLPPPYVCNVEKFDGVLGAMSAADPATGVVRFNAEYTITLPALTSVPNGGPPGVGFAVAQSLPPPTTGVTVLRSPGMGAFPEQLAITGTQQVQVGNTTITEEIPSSNVIDTKRNLFQTLVFGPPAGVPLRFMTWNIKRFTPFMHFVESLAPGSPLDDSQVPPELIGQFLASFDVVALQEAWDADDLQKILAAANAARATAGQTPFFQIGPIDFPKGQGISFDSTTGGVFILSKFPAQEVDFHIYSKCRGEDCLKAKGVLHARLNFSTTSVGGPSGAELKTGTGMKPDSFIDVYATHMQADELVCTDNNIASQVKEKALEGLICGALPEMWTACFIKDILEASLFHCYDNVDDQSVRESQVAELDAFVAGTADRTRPSIVMGDFNQDTAFLNADDNGNITGRYGQILSQLQLGNVGADESVAAPDDRLNPWPIGFGFPWQMNHSDVIRETFSDDFLTQFGRGTDIEATDPDDGPPGATQTKLGRIDYAFVRPGAQPGSSAFGNVSWMAGKPTTGAPIWSSPFPQASTPINTVGSRMSDHKPVIFSFQMVPFKVAPKFHSDFDHNLGFRVTTADDEGDDDCFLCGGVDLFTQVKKRAVSVTNVVGSSVFQGTTCEDGGTTVSAGLNPSCVGTWAFSIAHDPQINQVTGGGVQLWEEDDSPNPDDFLGTMNSGGTGGLYSVNWPAAQIQLRDWDTNTVVPCVDAACSKKWNDLSLTDNGKYGFCTRTTPPFVCVELDIAEVAP
jgi:Endonuclease/Exonuclease/phosphatase family